MMSTTTRYPIKPKTLTLLELSQSFRDFRHPPSLMSLYQYQGPPNAAQTLTRRLYLHPLSVNPNPKQQSSKASTTVSTTNVTSYDSEIYPQLNYDRSRDIHPTQKKLSHHGLAILSSSLPLTSRINPKFDTRHYHDKASVHTDSDMNSDIDASATTISFNQPSLSSVARGTLSSTHSMCNRPTHPINRRKIYPKPTRWEKIKIWHHLDQPLEQSIPISEKVNLWHPLERSIPICEKINVWHHLDQTLERPIPNDPPTTPLSVVSNFNVENDEPQNSYLNSNSIQGIKIYKRNPMHNSFISEDNDYDDYIYNAE